MIPKELIKDVTFDFDADETTCGPHIAYTLQSQGGAASGLNDSYLFKSKSISEEIINEAEEIIKAMLAQKSEVTLKDSTDFLELFRAYKNNLSNNN
ncbi:hypothetical protein [Aeromonas enteropelogenes]|uniref:hypothetical protein n=1 Tax=Aeromonas enteropelogenes TaxID=29489 RepID=UPI003F742D45